MLGTVQILCDRNLRVTSQGRGYCQHFTNEVTESQGRWITCFQSHKVETGACDLNLDQSQVLQVSRVFVFVLGAKLVGSSYKATSFPPQEWGRGREKTRAEEESLLPPKGMSGWEIVCHTGPTTQLHSLLLSYPLRILRVIQLCTSGEPIAQRWVVSGHDGGDSTSPSLFLGASGAWRVNAEQ